MEQQDKRWKEFNEELLKCMKANDLYGLGNIYYEMADFLKCEGKDNSDLLKSGYEAKLKFQSGRLQDYKKSGVCSGVEILSATKNPGNNCCKECRKLNGKIFQIDQALSINPLPVKNCTHEYGCRCCYGPRID